MMTIALDGDQLTIALSGDVDATTAYLPYEAAVEQFDEHEIREVVIDLAEVTFADSTALGTLVRIRDHAVEHGATCHLSNVPDHLRMLLNITGLDQTLEIS